jgi:hypothetical protein
LDGAAWDGYPNFVEELGSLALYGVFDVGGNASLVNFAKAVLKVKKFPSLVVYPVGDKKKAEGHVFSAANYISMIKKIGEVVDEDQISGLNDQEAQAKVVSSLVAKKFPVIFFHKVDKIPLALKVISSMARYRQYLDFYRWRNPPDAFREQWKIPRVPSLATVFKRNQPHEAIQNDQDLAGADIQIGYFDGKFKYDQIVKYLEQFITALGGGDKNDVQHVRTHDELSSLCSPAVGHCVIGFFNGNIKVCALDDGANSRLGEPDLEEST